MRPKLIIVGGANGSGKTTLAREFVSVENTEYLGADEIAREINVAQPEAVAIRAGRAFSERLENSLQAEKSLLVESTLSGLSLRKYFETARTNGYAITILFVFLDSAELCVQRVATRVAKGGHYVPDEDVRRRFHRSNRNFWNVYRELADEWRLFYNSGEAIIQVAGGDRSGTAILEAARYKEWQAMVK